MPFTIEYGPSENRTSMPSVMAMQIVRYAEALLAVGATDLRIIGADGQTTDLREYKAALEKLIIL